MKAHHFCWVLRIGYAACCQCGLLKLKNERSRKAASAPCKGSD